MKSTERFKEVVNKHLKSLAEKDSLFAETLKKEDKNIDDCITYILNQVQKSGCNGFADEEIFKMAVHYYDEDNIDVGKSVNTRVVVNHSVELSEEEKQTAKDKAMYLAIQEAKEEAKKKLAADVELTEDDLADVKQKAIQNIISEESEKLKKKKEKKKPEEKPEALSLFDSL